MSSSTSILESSSPQGLISHYTPPPEVYDELIDASGCLRNTWKSFIAKLDALGPAGIGQRYEQARILLRENGANYNIAGLSHSANKPYDLDPLPLLLDHNEWNDLSSSLAQRARLLNAILADIYGPQKLLENGLVPPELIYGNPGFLIPCHGINVPQDIYLQFYVSNLARGADGRWLVLSDCTLGPSGAGFSLLNRIIISWIFPHDFHNMHVQRQATFFIALREKLQSLAPQRPDNPRVVLLSAGPKDPKYFEDAYLARYLGYTLVEGGDLTVRGTTVYLKTLGGLLPVDTILRHIADEKCDPLEFEAESLQGVPGLVEAARSGKVVIVNALGGGLLEAPAMLPFLPAICRYLLGEDLRLPSVLTWWCAREADWQYVQNNFDAMVIRSAFSSNTPAIIVASLNQRDREELLSAIRRRPSAYVAQTRTVYSTAPVWNIDVMEPWHVGMQAFAVAERYGTYHVMQGGLARVAPTSEALNDLQSPGLRNKDVWILSDRPVATVSLLRPQTAAVELRRSGNDLPSRLADNLYWLGRHIERAEGMVRHLRGIVVRMSSEMDLSSVPELAILVRSLSEGHRLPEPGSGEIHEALGDMEKEVLSIMFNESRSGSLEEMFRSIYQTASIVRDRISADTWRLVNELDMNILTPRTKNNVQLGDVLLLLNQSLNLLSALSGLVTESMTRGPGWRFVDMGRRLERALSAIRLLKRTLVHQTATSTMLLDAILEIADSSMTYRYRYLTSLQLAPVLDLLLTDETNPRSVGFQISALADHVRQLPGKEQNVSRKSEDRIMIAMQATLRLADVERLAGTADQGLRQALDDFLSEMIRQLRLLSDSLTQTYFTHTGASRQLGSIISGDIS